MAIGDTWWGQYPWGATSAGYTYTVQPTWVFNTSGSYYNYEWPVAQQEAERPRMPESPMEWLERRVTEITDLAYAEI